MIVPIKDQTLVHLANRCSKLCRCVSLGLLHDVNLRQNKDGLIVLDHPLGQPNQPTPGLLRGITSPAGAVAMA